MFSNYILACYYVPQNKKKAALSLKQFSSHWFLNVIYFLQNLEDCILSEKRKILDISEKVGHDN